MDLFAIPVKKYKFIFWQTGIINLVIIIASYILAKRHIHLFPNFDPGQKLTLPILGAVVLLGMLHTWYQRTQLKKIFAIPHFDDKLEEYERFYSFRMWWYLFSCASSCFLTLLTGRYLFLFFAGFDIVVSLQLYPTLKMFRKELQNKEIMLY